MLNCNKKEIRIFLLESLSNSLYQYLNIQHLRNVFFDLGRGSWKLEFWGLSLRNLASWLLAVEGNKSLDRAINMDTFFF